MRTSSRPFRPIDVRPLAVRVTALVLLSGPTSALAQSPPADSAAVGEAHELQREFERFRESRTPVDRGPQRDGECDERIGRICIWFGGEEEEDFPGELRETSEARVKLISGLFDAYRQVQDRWILGQLVHYLVEHRDMGEATRVATECGIDETWWCSALLGYVLHVNLQYPEAEAAFRESLDLMPDSVWHEWTTPHYVFTPDAVEEFNRAPPQERERRFELLWRLSDPLFLFDGNDRFTDHFARLVVAENRRDAADPIGLEWEEDLEETLIRYGRNTGYSRVQDLQAMMRNRLLDTRRMIGHHHPKSRGYLFPEQFLASPWDIPPESWITAPREARTWYAPPYAPEVRGLETQVGRFRRGGRMLVVGAYRPMVPSIEEGALGELVPAWSPESGLEGEPYAALYLVPETGEEPLEVRSRDAEGVLNMEVVPGLYVSSLEVVDLEGRQAWRARQGVAQFPLIPGLVDVSDLMILKEGAPLPTSLEEALPHVRPGVRIRQGERFPILWEAYGLRIREPIQVTIGFSAGRPGFLERVGEFLGVIEPEQPVNITFDDLGGDRLQESFHALEIELPDLEPGEYTLHLRLQLFGREPVVTSRPIVVEG